MRELNIEEIEAVVGGGPIIVELKPAAMPIIVDFEPASGPIIVEL